MMVDRLRFLRALQSRPFTLFWAGQTLSALGNGAHYVALAWQVLLLTGSGTAMSVVLISSTIPSLLFLLIGGAIADRLPRRLVLLWSDAGRAFIVLTIAGLGWFHLLQFWHLVAMGLLFGFASGFFTPAYQAVSPQLVETDALPSANALNGLSGQVGFLLGPVLGVGCIALGGPALAFVFDGLTFAVSTLCLFAITQQEMFSEVSRSSESRLMETEETNVSPISFVSLKVQGEIVRLYKDVRDGLRYVTGSTWLWITIVASALANMGLVGSFEVALPKLVYSVFGTGAWFLGVLGTASAVGSITGTLLIGQMHQLRRRGMLAYLFLLVASVGLMLCGLPLPLLSALVITSTANALIGFSLGAFGILWITLMQELIPEDKLGRVSSIDWLGSLCLTPVGYALAGLLTDLLGPRWVFLSSGILLLALVSSVLFCIRDIRRVE